MNNHNILPLYPLPSGGKQMGPEEAPKADYVFPVG